MQIQVALDVLDLERAIDIATAVTPVTNRIEVGTLLLRRHGVRAITSIRERLPSAVLVADCKTMDYGAVDARLVLDAGADGLIVQAAAPGATISAACASAKESDGFVMADGLGLSAQELARRTLDISISQVIVHSGVDEQIQGRLPFADLERMRALAPERSIAVAGGISLNNVATLLAVSVPDIVIIGRAICDSSDPFLMARGLMCALEGTSAS